MNLLEFLEADFLDEALYACVYRCDMLIYMGIVRPLHIAKVGKIKNDDCGTHNKQYHNYDIVSPT